MRRLTITGLGSLVGELNNAKFKDLGFKLDWWSNIKLNESSGMSSSTNERLWQLKPAHPVADRKPA